MKLGGMAEGERASEEDFSLFSLTQRSIALMVTPWRTLRQLLQRSRRQHPESRSWERIRGVGSIWFSLNQFESEYRMSGKCPPPLPRLPSSAERVIGPRYLNGGLDGAEVTLALHVRRYGQR